MLGYIFLRNGYQWAQTYPSSSKENEVLSAEIMKLFKKKKKRKCL